MALTVTNALPLTLSASGFGTGAYTPAAFTPGTGKRLVVRVFMMSASDDGVAGSDITITDSMGPLTWTPIVGSAAGDSVGWGYAARAFISSATTGAGSMTVTVDCGAFSAYAYAVIVDALGGEDASPLGATATGSDADGDGSLSITLNGTPASTSQLFAALVRAESSDGGVVTPGTGWTEEAEAREIGWFAFQAQRRTGTTSTTVTWDDIAANAGQAGALALAFEIKEAGGGGGGGGGAIIVNWLGF